MYHYVYIYNIYIIGAKESYIYTYIVHRWAHHKSLLSFLHSEFVFPSRYLLKMPWPKLQINDAADSVGGYQA